MHASYRSQPSKCAAELSESLPLHAMTADPHMQGFAEGTHQPGQHISDQTTSSAQAVLQQQARLQCTDSLKRLDQPATSAAAFNAAASDCTVDLPSAVRVADCPASSNSLTAAHDAVPVTSSQPFANTKSCAIRSAAAARGWKTSSSSLGTCSVVAEPANSLDAYDAEEQLHSSVDSTES